MAIFIKIPESLRAWFFIHFIIDYVIAIPLFLFPNQTLAFLGWEIIDPLTIRFVSAALFAIGGISFISRHSETVIYKHLITLKIIWSLFAIIGILLTAFTDKMPILGYIILAIFVFFASIWIYYYSILNKLK